MEKADKNEKERLRDREKDSAKALLEAHLYPKGPSDSTLISNLHKNIKLIDSENTGLKSNLLSLIHDYKLLKDLVLNKHTTTDSNVRKRSFTEVVDTPDVQLTELINDMSDLSYQSQGLIVPRFKFPAGLNRDYRIFRTERLHRLHHVRHRSTQEEETHPP